MIALARAIHAGRERGTCWAHLAKVLRQMRTEYQAGDFGITFIGERTDRPELGWREYLERLMKQPR